MSDLAELGDVLERQLRSAPVGTLERHRLRAALAADAVDDLVEALAAVDLGRDTVEQQPAELLHARLGLRLHRLAAGIVAEGEIPTMDVMPVQVGDQLGADRTIELPVELQIEFPGVPLHAALVLRDVEPDQPRRP